MQLKTILNRVQRHKSFVYGEPRWASDALQLSIEVPIEPRANGRPICSGCRKPRPGYDRLRPRRFEFVPLWQIAVVFVYALRRVDCRKRPVRHVLCGLVALSRGAHDIRRLDHGWTHATPEWGEGTVLAASGGRTREQRTFGTSVL